jgi:hypothetical protein
VNEVTDLLRGEPQPSRPEVNKYSGSPLIEDEIRYLRAMMESDKFSRRLGTFVRVVLGWIVGGVVMVTMLSESIGKFFRWFIPGGPGGH